MADYCNNDDVARSLDAEDKTLTREQIAKMRAAYETFWNATALDVEAAERHFWKVAEYLPTALSMAEECLRQREINSDLSDSVFHLGEENLRLRAAVEPMLPYARVFVDRFRQIPDGAYVGYSPDRFLCQGEMHLTVGMLRALLAAMEPEAKP